MNKIKVLHIADELRRGGKERQLVELIKGINKDRFEIYVISFLPRKDGYDEEVKGLVKGFSYMERKYKWDLSLVSKLIKYCKRNEIDIIYTWDGMTSLYALLASFYTRVKFINGSIRDTDTRKSYKHIYKRIVIYLSKHIIANSYAGLRVYNAEHRGKVIYNGLNLSRFNKVKTLSNKKFVIGTVANLTEYKDYYTFFDAIKLLVNVYKDFEVHIIGWGKLADIYKSYAEKSGIIDYLKFIGRISNTEEYIPNFDIGILCSYKEKGEGLSNSVIEYMACGVPPIITNIGAAKEIIEDGKTGLLFDAGNSSDLFRKIMILLENKTLREKIGEAAKISVKDKFLYRRYLLETEKLYTQIMKNNIEK